MSDGLRLQCPHCSTVLKVKATSDIDPSRRIKCPKCSNAFSIAEGSTEPPAVPKTPKAETRQKAAEPRSRAAEPAEEPQPAPRKKKKAQAKSSESWDEQGDMFGGVSSEGAAYDDEWGGGGDQYGGDPWSGGGGSKSGSSRQAPKSSPNKTRSKQTSQPSALRNLGVFGWFLFGGLAVFLGIGLSTVFGFTNLPFVIGIAALFVGPLVGFGVRFGAGPYTSGIGPGLFAAFLAVIAIIAGKFGAFCVADIKFGEEDTEEVAAQGEGSFMDELEKEALAEPALISRIADKVEEEWIAGGKLTQEQVDAYWENQEEAYDPSADYLPEVWQEAGNRWNGMTPDVRAATIRQVQQDYYGDEMDAEMEPISEIEAKEWIASKVTEEWLASGRITSEQIESFEEQQMNAPENYSANHLPEVWQEANNRWAAMSPDQKSALQQEVRTEMQQVREMGEKLEAGLGWVFVVFMTIGNCFWPISNPFFFAGGVGAAFKLGSRNESGK